MSGGIKFAELNTLLSLLVDAEKGFRDLAELVDAAPCRVFLLEEAFIRATYAAELRRAIDALPGGCASLSSTLPGSLHRRYIELKSALGASDALMLDSLHECEQVASRAYQTVLEDDTLPESMYALLRTQSAHVQRALPVLLNLCKSSVT